MFFVCAISRDAVSTKKVQIMGRTEMNMWMDNVLRGMDRCPHCGVASPTMELIYKSDCICPPANHYGHIWGVYKCNSCKLAILAQSVLGNQGTTDVLATYQSLSAPDIELPERVRTYLGQATASLHAPDGAVMLAGAAVDMMLKEKGYLKGSVYARIDEAVTANVLTTDMGEWAHDVRLGSNRPRHADDTDPHVSSDEAKQAVEFAKMLGHFLLVLPARVSQKAKQAKQV
jgi:hypothetical protein